MEILLKNEKETEGINIWRAAVNEIASSFIASFMKIIRHTYNQNYNHKGTKGIVLQEEKHITKNRTSLLKQNSYWC